eukprot:5688812-Amphidinium_carterae.1
MEMFTNLPFACVCQDSTAQTYEGEQTPKRQPVVGILRSSFPPVQTLNFMDNREVTQTRYTHASK